MVGTELLPFIQIKESEEENPMVEMEEMVVWQVKGVKVEMVEMVEM